MVVVDDDVGVLVELVVDIVYCVYDVFVVIEFCVEVVNVYVDGLFFGGFVVLCLLEGGDEFVVFDCLVFVEYEVL